MRRPINATFPPEHTNERPGAAGNVGTQRVEGLRSLADLLCVYTRVESTPQPAISRKSKGKWGGARLKANRTTPALSVGQVSNLVAAMAYAKDIGLPLNRFITIHWEKAGVPDCAAVKAIGQFLKRLKDWMKKQGVASGYVWVRENGENKGSHVHIIAHVPAEFVRRLTRLQLGWIRRISGRRYQKNTIESRPVGFGLNVEHDSPEAFALNVDAVASYILKGASDDAAREFSLNRRESGGVVCGKRCGASENLSQRARNLYYSDGSEGGRRM